MFSIGYCKYWFQCAFIQQPYIGLFHLPLPLSPVSIRSSLPVHLRRKASPARHPGSSIPLPMKVQALVLILPHCYHWKIQVLFQRLLDALSITRFMSLGLFFVLLPCSPSFVVFHILCFSCRRVRLVFPQRLLGLDRCVVVHLVQDLIIPSWSLLVLTSTWLLSQGKFMCHV